MRKLLFIALAIILAMFCAYSRVDSGSFSFVNNTGGYDIQCESGYYDSVAVNILPEKRKECKRRDSYQGLTKAPDVPVQE